MRNFKQIVFISGVSVAVAVAGLTGCSTWKKDSGGRSAGRVVDDKNINSEIKTKLTKEPVYKFTDVDVKTFDGVVQLSGFVRNQDQKLRAGELAQSVSGVARVVNNITLIPETPTPTGRMDTTNAPQSGATTNLQNPQETTPQNNQNQASPPQ